ncbi:TetR/AcrR family transcriptional regulator [Saccharibacillus sp. CPCC 101409]|uniref:TetR/AcrR family transcriptional regulator n=1 Tax=Saccharibacillus sp. CPCC 101409 TaxID=3058041 RepID=UPI002673FBC1|nr:TetR/AcrR family transcriptional regulator [Saccharibacillus sp. CPCC 101409]MDO3409833.1 TetR/AcrR family transcriptional regulator [Saccharibacillus sp. CPCC 101409]
MESNKARPHKADGKKENTRSTGADGAAKASLAPSRGRPRSEEVHAGILQATLDVLAEGGVDKLSIETVAQRAGVGKSSIYRRWGGKDELIVAALERIKPEMNTDLHGDLPESLFALSSSFAQRMNNPLGRQMLSLLISTLAGSSPVSESYWEQHSLPKTQEISLLVERFRESERLRGDVDLNVVTDFMVGFAVYRLLLKPAAGEAELDAELKQAVDLLLNGLRER